MTTNHRPTLESKRGKVKSINDSIVHARALPQSGSLKYRTDIPSVKFEDGVKELKRELLQLEGNAKKKWKQDEITKFVDKETFRNEEKLVSKSVNTEKTDSENVDKKEEDAEDQDEENDDDDDDDDDDDPDSDDEEALLMAEIAKIRKERSEKEKPKVNNSLEDTAQDNKPVKKSWRSSTFSNKKKQAEETQTNTSDSTIDSEFHKKFLSKYVR